MTSPLLHLTYDLSSATNTLISQAIRSALDALDVTDLAIAAVAFTAQLAIDVLECTPTEIRVLEAALMAKLRESRSP